MKKRKCFWWFPIRLTTYEIVKNHEDMELVITGGIINRRTEKLKLYRVTDISYNRSLGNFLFGQGNITLSTTERNGSSEVISKIHGYKEFGNKIEEIAYQERKRMNVGYKEHNVD